MKFKMTLLSLAMALPSFSTLSAPLAIDQHIPNEQEVNQSNAWLEVSLGQFKSNIEQFKSHIKSETKICAVMKADAYGNGIHGLMPTIIEQQIPCVAIASNAEARAVRDSGFKGQLLRVRSASLSEIKQSVDLDIEELIGSHQQAKDIADFGIKNNKTIKVHLALNNGGMGRNGIDMSTSRGKDEALDIATQSHLDVVGIMTHFPNYNADDVRLKLKDFQADSSWLIKEADLTREDITLHVANSYVSLNVPEAQLDMVRPGGVLYGDLPTNPEYPSIVSFKTRVASIHQLPANKTVGYDSTFTTTRDSVLANIPVGYSDGYPRKMGNKAYVIINGQRAKVVGMTSMNTAMVDITGLEGIRQGQDVILFGHQQGESISVSEMEANASLIFPELYTVWGLANPRYYLND
ncbi:alanine racemase [Photobacterium sanguinicancri]|uniref:Broad specificity amino-acid racemase n=1 Tax=Photobacterium sanguinicancri TaxID=875932 RepID=A0AAW7XZ21_9GAMM|nr:alanine racemase [Photobacterium sanguinicancri]KXI21105.1 alanine racemase [Photobacterium sanguinicancri]MDO6541347.1 alanine racemase [Photobacterium sanguinicancri]OZS43181.1 alanine racemase [Photobacterium sanguinicancri]